jgi:hypothetical protein
VAAQAEDVLDAAGFQVLHELVPPMQAAISRAGPRQDR